MKNNKQRLRNLWNNSKTSDIYIIGVSRKLDSQVLNEIMTEHTHNLVKDTNLRSQQSKQTWFKIVKSVYPQVYHENKVQEWILETAKEKWCINSRKTSVQMTADVLSEKGTSWNRKEMIKERNLEIQGRKNRWKECRNATVSAGSRSSFLCPFCQSCLMIKMKLYYHLIFKTT